MRWHRRRGQGRRLTLAEANLRAQVEALEPEREPSPDTAAAPEQEHGIPAADDDTPEVVDVAALEREQLFASHPRAEPPEDQDSDR